MLNLKLELLKFALLTISIELPIFYLCGYKQLRLVLAFALVNLVSNLLLNEALPAYTNTFSYWLTLSLGEILVVLLEFALMLYLIANRRVFLFKVILLTNLVSLSIGLMLFFF